MANHKNITNDTSLNGIPNVFYHRLNLVPSFLNFDIRPMVYKKWCFSAQAELQQYSLLNNDIYDSDIGKNVNAFLINYKEKDNRSDRNDSQVEDTICKILKNTDENDEEEMYLNKDCPGKQVCSIYTYSRRHKVEQQRIKRRENRRYNDLSDIDKAAKKLIINKQINVDESHRDERKILGDITLCGNREEPGTFARAINILLFRTTRFQDSSDNETLNVNYVHSFTCYNRDYSYHEIYGTPDNRINKKTTKEVGKIINSILIQPITGHKEWLEYSLNLLEMLNCASEKSEYFIDYDSPTSPKWITITNFDAMIKDDDITKEDDMYIFNKSCEGRGEKWDCKILYHNVYRNKTKLQVNNTC